MLARRAVAVDAARPLVHIAHDRRRRLVCAGAEEQEGQGRARAWHQGVDSVPGRAWGE